MITKDRVVPRGWFEGSGASSFEQYCLHVGHSCAGWIIANENMDYLHCKDLSFTGKTKCD